MWRHAISTLIFSSLTSAHFVLLWPPNAGFDEDKEPTSPCGGFTPDVNSSATDLHVEKFAVSIQNVHPEGQWGFRATTDTEPPYKFVDIVPLVKTTEIGDFRLDEMRAPSNFAGKSGILQVVDNSLDGILYQCAAVNFVSGANNTVGSACTNSSSQFTAEWTNQQEFKGEAGGTPTGSGSSSSESAASSPTASAASSSSSGVAAMITGVGSLVGGLGLLAAGLAL